MSNNNNPNTSLADLAKTAGAIVGLPLTIYTIITSITEKPGMTLVMALVLAAFVSFYMGYYQKAKINNIIIAWLVLAVLTLGGYIIWPKTMTVEGMVIDASGNVVAQEVVSLKDVNGVDRTSITDNEGHYEFINVPIGKYIINVRGTRIEGTAKGGLIRTLTVNLTISSQLSPPIDSTTTPSPTQTIRPTDEPTTPVNIIETETMTPYTTPTDTPAPTSTPTPTPTSILGGGNCLSSTIWTPYQGVIAPVNKNNCWQAERYGLFSSNNLEINLADLTTKKFYGIYTSLPAQSQIHFTIQIDKFTTLNNEDGNLVFAVVPTDAIDPKYGVELMFQVEISVPTPPPIELKFHERNKPEIYIPDLAVFERGRKYDFILEITTSSFNIYMDGEKIAGPISISFSDRNLWIGYSLPAGGELSAVVSNFYIIK